MNADAEDQALRAMSQAVARLDPPTRLAFELLEEHITGVDYTHARHYQELHGELAELRDGLLPLRRRCTCSRSPLFLDPCCPTHGDDAA